MLINAYCANTPVMYSDISGNFALVILGIAVVITGTQIIELAAIAAAVTALIWWIDSGSEQTVELINDITEQSEVVGTSSKDRNENPIAKRKHFNSRKDAKEAAKRDGKNKPPIHHPGGKTPHYHPDVPIPKDPTPKAPNPHDHYYYPKGK